MAVSFIGRVHGENHWQTLSHNDASSQYIHINSQLVFCPNKLNFFLCISDSVYRPVASYENYIRRLHPSNDRLWQKPLDSFPVDRDVWYCNMPIGEKKLSVFMSELSKKCNLSQIYTNHSIWATGATVLAKNMYGSAQIMAVTGHRSVQSLTTYQRVDTGRYSHWQHTNV